MIFRDLDDVILKVAVFVLAVAGFFVARHIRKHKDSEESPLVCMAGFDCNTVVHSDYSTIFGIHLDLVGMMYYAFMSFAYLLLIFVGHILPNFFIYFIVGGSLFAFLFSIYLICVQIFILKKGCSWCVVEACISVVIFILNIFAYDFWSIVHLLLR